MEADDTSFRLLPLLFDVLLLMALLIFAVRPGAGVVVVGEASRQPPGRRRAAGASQRLSATQGGPQTNTREPPRGGPGEVAPQKGGP